MNSEFCHLKWVSENYRHRGQAACRTELRWGPAGAAGHQCPIWIGLNSLPLVVLPDPQYAHQLPQNPPRCRSLSPPRWPTHSLELQSSPVHSPGQKSPFPSKGCPDFSFLPGNAEVELSPTKCFMVHHLLVCFFKGWGCQGRAPVAPAYKDSCKGHAWSFSKSFRRSCSEKSMLDIGSNRRLTDW